MLAIPAIDIKDGKVVRLIQGEYEKVKVYSPDPVQIAKDWQEQGARRLHLVDLDGARTGKMKNISILHQIVKSVRIPIQFGGGLRTHEDISDILGIGAKWVILGTRACEDLDFVKENLAEFGEQIMVSIDVKDKKVAARGWTETTQIEDVELIKRLQSIGVESFIYTDISRDGTLSGFNIEAVKRVLDETGAAIFYSGGISSLDDVENINSLKDQGLAGIIIGKALYEDKIRLMDAIKLLEEQT